MEAAEQVSQSFLDFMHQKPRQCSLFTAWALSGEASSGALSRCSSSVVMSNDGKLHNHELQAHSSSKPYESSTESEPVMKAHDYIGLAEVSSASSSVNENECVSDCEDTDLRLALGPFKDDHSMQRSLPSLELEPKDRAITAGQSSHRMSANLFMSTGVMPYKNGFKRAFGEALGEASPCSLMASSAFMQCKGMAQSENQQIKILPSWPASKCTSVYSSREAVKRHDESERYTSALVELPPAKGQVVGWPPIRAYRRNIVLVSPNQPKENEEGHLAMYVKVNMDGIPIGRKVDLNVYSSYESLVSALEEMFYNPSNGNSAQFLSNRMFALTYEDKEGDWMLVGDVPWGMFVNSVKRLRIVRGSEATGLGPRR